MLPEGLFAEGFSNNYRIAEPAHPGNDATRAVHGGRRWNLRSEEKRDDSRRGAEAQRMIENDIGTRVIEAAIAVHRELGPGLLETVYEVMRTGNTRCVNGLEEHPLRPCATAEEKQVPTTGCYVAGIPSP